MTAQGHNKILFLVHGLIGIVAFVGILFAAVVEMRRTAYSGTLSKLPLVIYYLPIPLLQLLTAYGLFKRKRWARIIAFLLSVPYLWIFPLGTVLTIYTWWFLLSVGGKELYSGRNL